LINVTNALTRKSYSTVSLGVQQPNRSMTLGALKADLNKSNDS